ncbi:O-antigen ligase family protein [Streptomyces sp. 8N706]|uniref:O-antigen ligase family protein n=1 Tax=Streptomyces sp. 8N706 TaxID=3457416 RepID=UPI003FD3D373
MTTLPILQAPARARFAGAWRVLPAVATVLLLCAPDRDEQDITAAFHITTADVASAVLVVLCAVALLRDRQRPLPRVTVAVLGAPALAFAVATIVSRDPAVSLPGFVRYLQIFVLVPASVVLLLRSRRDFRWLAAAVIAVAVFQGAVGVHQYVTGTGASYSGQDIRAVGTFSPLDVMGMATIVAHGIVLALALGLAPPAGSPRWLRPASLSCAGLLLLPLAFSFSRGAWIATALACTVVLVLAGLRTALSALAVLFAAAVVLVSGAGAGSALIGERLTSIVQVTDTPDRSVTDRYTMWAAAVSIWRDAPVTGVGIKGFPAHRDGHASIGLSASSDSGGAGMKFRRVPLLTPHNMYLLILSEQGLIGLTVVVGSWTAVLVLGVRRLRRDHRNHRKPRDVRGLRRSGRPVDCGLAAVGLLVYQLADFLYSDIGGPETVITALTLGMAAWWALGRDSGDAAPAAQPQHTPTHAAASRPADGAAHP